MYRYIALAALFAAVAPAHAGELVPYGTERIELGSIRGATYFTEVHGGYRVITTLADGEAGLPVRFEATLADHQSLTLSVPGWESWTRGQVIEISRAGDRLVVSKPQPAADKIVVTGPRGGTGL